ncbi:MAG: hypothetical protein HQ471_05030 [Flavobacteriales bacterium]|nr:hypothetical protein [Flavobacteriales bacterium]
MPIGFYITRIKESHKGAAWEVHSKFRGDTVYGKIGQFDKFLYFDNEGKLLASE